jgi:hypothetical protein
MSGTNLTHQETLLLQDAGFKLQEHPSMSPQGMFMLSNLFEAPVFDHLALQIWTFIRQLRIASLFGGMQTPQQLSIATSGRVIATSGRVLATLKEWSLISLFFFFLV